MRAEQERQKQRAFFLHVWLSYLVVSVCLGVVVTVIQLPLHNMLVLNEWEYILSCMAFPNIFNTNDALRERWSLENLPSKTNISHNHLILSNKLILVDNASIRSTERFRTSGRPWVIILNWEGGCQQRPHFSSMEEYKSIPFFLSFHQSDCGQYVFKVDPDSPNGCGLYFEGRDGEELIGECSQTCRGAIRNGRHSLMLKGEQQSIVALIDGSVCASGRLDQPFDFLKLKLRTLSPACIAFDDLEVLIEESGGVITTLLEEHFDVIPFQIRSLDQGLDLDSMGARVAVTWAALAAALLFDLVSIFLIGRRHPLETLLVVSLPQGIMLFVLQIILFLPLAPILLCTISLWTSKAILTFRGLPKVGAQEDRRAHWTSMIFLSVAVFLLALLVTRIELGTGTSFITLTMALIAALIFMLSGSPIGSMNKRRLILYFTICVFQCIHFLWFRKFWFFSGCTTIALASLIPAALVLVLYIGLISKPTWMRVSGKIFTALFLIVCIEAIARSNPIERYLDFDWRVANKFWNLKRHTNLLVDHSKEEFFTDSHGAVFQRAKPKGVYRIICLGSSSTEGFGSHNGKIESYPSQLDLLLDRCLPGSVEVINAGIGGYGPTQLRIYFEDILSGSDPDLLIFYFGTNADLLPYLDYYKRVLSVLEANPQIQEPKEIEAGLSLRWPHPTLVKAYLVLARSRLFIGMKLIVDEILTVTRVIASQIINQSVPIESTDLLVKAVLKSGSIILLIPEITSSGSLACKSMFEEIVRQYKGKRVHLLNIEEFDVSSYMVDYCHMNSSGYRELARIISDYLISSSFVICEPGNVWKMKEKN